MTNGAPPPSPGATANQHSRPFPLERPLKISRTNNHPSDDEEAEAEVDELGTIPKEHTGDMSKNPRAQRYMVAIEYIGTRFSGSQKQLNCRTVVGVLEEAFHKFVCQPVTISCSSRTDAGVHALMNVCHVDVERISKRKPGEVLPPHEPIVVKRAVNHFLQKNDSDIMVTDVRCVPANFHARFKARERTYFYRLLSGQEPLSVFERNRAWHVPEELNLLAIQKACKVLVGCHDFSSFRAAGCQAKSPVKTLEELGISELKSNPHFPSMEERKLNCETDDLETGSEKPEADILPSSSSNHARTGDSCLIDGGFGKGRGHRCYVVTARAPSFLYHQVRLLVGVLKCVGTGELTASDVESILEARTVTAAPPMAPACGLYLANVKYDLS